MTFYLFVTLVGIALFVLAALMVYRVRKRQKKEAATLAKLKADPNPPAMDYQFEMGLYKDDDPKV